MNAEELDRASSKQGLRLIGHSDLGGQGAGMHINIKDGIAFFGHMDTTGTSLVDVTDPRSPKLVGRIPAPANTHSHKVQIVDDVMLVNRERLPPRFGGSRKQSWTAGISVYDVSDARDPKEIAFWPSGGRGVHRPTFFSFPYAFLSAGDGQYGSSLVADHGRGEEEGLVILDLSDPTRPHEVGRFWIPGMRYDEPRTWKQEIVKYHHGIPRGDRLYCGWWDHGLVILDISDVTRPALVSHLRFPEGESRNTHTALPLPGRDVLVVTDECNVDGPDRMDFQVRVVDISDELRPKVVGTFPIPDGPFLDAGLRFGPHNVHEMRPGSHQDPNIVHMTYFNAGLRLYDVSDPTDPREIAFHVPPAPDGQPAIQLNDVYVAQDGLIYASDRYAGGLYIFERD